MVSVVLVSSLLLFQNCGGTQGDIAVSGGLTSNYGGPAVATSSTNTLNQLQGSWELACTAAGTGYVAMQMTVSGSSFTITKATSTTSDCATDQQSETMTGTLTIPTPAALTAPASATALNALLLTDIVTPLNTTSASGLNASDVCGFRAWVANSAHACANNVGQTILGNFYYDGYSLQLGLGLTNVVAGSSGTSGNRLNAFDGGYWFTLL